MKHSILFIDDDSEKYSNIFNQIGNELGFTFYIASEVAEGLTFLAQNQNAIDAVLLDISFKEGQMQGLETLKIIKTQYPFLPVIMLTGSDNASDLHKVVECMRNGAYDYIGKRNLKVKKLLEVLLQAIQKSQEQYRRENKNIRNKSDEDYFYIVSELDNRLYKKQAVFGYHLIAANKPKNNEEIELLRNSTIQWHKNLLDIIHTYRNNICVNLKYIAENGKLNCYILFTLAEVDEEKLIKILKEFQFDIRSFFNLLQSDLFNPYIFEEIKDTNLLTKTIKRDTKYHYTQFFRIPEIIAPPAKLGYTLDSEDSSLDNEKILPFPHDLEINNNFLKALLNQDCYTEIDIQLKPEVLTVKESEIINNVISNPSIIKSKHTQEEVDDYLKYLKHVTSSASNIFFVNVQLKQNAKKTGSHLLNGVKNHFFATPVIEHSLLPKNSVDTFEKDAEETNRMIFLYTENDVIHPFHLPLVGVDFLPGIKLQSPSFYTYPDSLPNNDGILLGEKNVGGKLKEIRIGYTELTRHLYIMGQTGTGKSTMLKSMIKDCIEKKQGFALIDPHGDLYNDIIRIIPKNREKDVFVINTSDPNYSYTFNPLIYDKTKPYLKSLIVNEILRSFLSLYQGRLSDAFGPAFETMMKNSLLLIMDEGNPNLPLLSDVKRFFHDSDFREWLLDKCTNEEINAFFKQSSRWSGDQDFENWAMYITAKLTRFVDDYFLRKILCSSEKQLKFREIMDSNKILLLKMDKGLIGSDNASLLGQLVLSNITLTAMSRSDIDIKQRKPYYVFIDEFQNFMKSDISTALSEVRKYGLSLIMANQTMAQLSQEMRDSLLGNVGSMVFFRSGIADYDNIKNYVEPEFEKSDILKMENFNCVARLLIDNIPSDPFNFQTKI